MCHKILITEPRDIYGLYMGDIWFTYRKIYGFIYRSYMVHIWRDTYGLVTTKENSGMI